MSEPSAEKNQQGRSGLHIARQAILDLQRNVFGYELLDSSRISSVHEDSNEAEFLFNALSAPESEPLLGKKAVFIQSSLDSLAGGHLDLVDARCIVLQIFTSNRMEKDKFEDFVPALEDAHRKGFRLSFDHSVLGNGSESWLPLASFIEFDTWKIRADLMQTLVRRARTGSTARLIARNVETSEQFRQLQEMGFSLFQGNWFSRPVMLTGQTLRPSQAAILQLVNLVRKQASTGEIEEQLKLHPTLSFQLLRFINSAGFGMAREITSFRHAVMLLGLNRLFKWAVLLMSTSSSEDTAPAVGITAVVRGRLMELLALNALPPEEVDNAFVVGVFSLIDTMLGIPMDKALATVNLPQSVTEALLHHQGPLARYLDLTLACETGDDLQFAAAASDLGLEGHTINWAHVQALAWAETLVSG